ERRAIGPEPVAHHADERWTEGERELVDADREADEHAPECRPVERKADREAAPPLEPRREDDVDRRATHRAPAHRHHEEDRIELPRPADEPERRKTGGH